MESCVRTQACNGNFTSLHQMARSSLRRTERVLARSANDSWLTLESFVGEVVMSGRKFKGLAIIGLLFTARRLPALQANWTMWHINRLEANALLLPFSLLTFLLLWLTEKTVYMDRFAGNLQKRAFIYPRRNQLNIIPYMGLSSLGC